MAVSRGIRAAIANMTPEQRFWGHVEKTPSCWNWVGAGARSERGYGRFQPVLGCRKLVQAHRFAYETLRGLIPAGLELDHLCRNRFCVNPDHLEPVTPQTNQHRSNSVSGTNARKTVCSRGQPCVCRRLSDRSEVRKTLLPGVLSIEHGGLSSTESHARTRCRIAKCAIVCGIGGRRRSHDAHHDQENGMSDKDNGGPAFPTHWPRSDDATEWTEAGMSLRDYFASRALSCFGTAHGLTAAERIAVETGLSLVQAMSNMAYELADAMIAERAR
jgi:hypothetical protein